jgi:molybdenum cofactor synthesis domain-containing protein
MVERRIYRGDRKGGRVVPHGNPAPRAQSERIGPFHVEIVTIGRELLRGYVTDANSRFLATDVSQRGAVVHRITVVDDDEQAIALAVTESLTRGANMVVTTGGLGPTTDDCTLAGVADALGVPLGVHPHATEMVEGAFRRLKDEGQVTSTGMTRTREKLCALPVGGEPVPNEAGIPPGVILRLPGGSVVACLPGTPRECESVWQALVGQVKELNAPVHRAQRELEAPTADESALQPILTRVRDEYPTVWIKTFAPGWKRGRRMRGARVVFEGTANTQHEAEIAVEGAMQRLLALAGEGK